MNSFLRGVRRTDNLPTNRHPAVKALTPVTHTQANDTPPTGVIAIARPATAESTGEERETAPLQPEPASPATPATLTSLLVPEPAIHTATLRHVPVPMPGQTASTAPLPAQVTEGAHAMAQLGVKAVFKALLWATDQKVISQMERRDRVIFLLLDGRRTIRDIAHLIHRNELDIARTIVRLLKSGYIVPVETPR